MAKANYLIAGLSGTGKSSVCQELIERGIYAIDADTVYGQHIDQATGKVDHEKRQANWIWNKEKLLTELVSKKQEVLFLCGGTMNQEDFYKYFDKVFFLVADDETLQSRLHTRRPIRSANSIKDLEEQRKWNSEILSYVEQKGFIAIDASGSLQATVKSILQNTMELNPSPNMSTLRAIKLES